MYLSFCGRVQVKLAHFQNVKKKHMTVRCFFLNFSISIWNLLCRWESTYAHGLKIKIVIGSHPPVELCTRLLTRKQNRILNLNVVIYVVPKIPYMYCEILKIYLCSYIILYFPQIYPDNLSYLKHQMLRLKNSLRVYFVKRSPSYWLKNSLHIPW